MRNPYKHIGLDPVIATNRGTPEFFMGKLDNQANFQNSVSSLISAGASLGFSASELKTLKEEHLIPVYEKDHQH